MNRVVNGIAKMEAQIAQRIENGIVTAEQVEQARQNMDMSDEEYCMFQERKSLAVASGELTLEEGQTIYAYMGANSVDHFNKQSIAVKTILTKIFAELIERQ